MKKILYLLPIILIVLVTACSNQTKVEVVPEDYLNFIEQDVRELYNEKDNYASFLEGKELVQRIESGDITFENSIMSDFYLALSKSYFYFDDPYLAKEYIEVSKKFNKKNPNIPLFEARIDILLYDSEEASKILKKITNEDSNEYKLAMGEYYFSIKEFEQSASFLEDVEKGYLDEYVFSILSQIYLYSEGNIDKAYKAISNSNRLDLLIDYYIYIDDVSEMGNTIDKLFSLDENSMDQIYNSMGLIAFYKDEMFKDKALKLCNNLITFSKDTTSSVIYNIELLYIKGEYNMAYDYLVKNKEYLTENDYYLLLSNIYFLQGRLSTAIKNLEDNEDKIYDLYEYNLVLGYCYNSLFNDEKSLLYFDKAIEYNEFSYNVCLSLANLYYMKSDNIKGEFYLSLAKKNAPNNEDVLEQVGEIEKKGLPFNIMLAQGFRDQYLYYSSEMDNEINKLTNMTNYSIKDIYDSFYAIALENDPFSFLIFSDYYDDLDEYTSQEEKSVEYLDENTTYITFNTFGETVHDWMVELLFNIENSEDETLIIDLRDNGGGNLYPCIIMLDALLPECEILNMKDRDEEKEEYESSASFIEFKEIYIFVNGGSASCSEVVALSLKENLDNVIIVGEKTLGKGVSQIVLDKEAEKYLGLVVHNKWYVYDNEIHGIGIQPDLLVESAMLSDYLKAIGK